MKAESAIALMSLLQTLQRWPEDSQPGKVLGSCIPDVETLIDELKEERARANRNACVVFAFEMPGYILVGVDGEAYPVPDPGLDGLTIAHDVFFNGLAAPAVLRASDWGKSPNATGNALRRAADWADQHCPQLAEAIRGISIREGGVPEYRGTIQVRTCF